jgi:hypothetical protein
MRVPRRMAGKRFRCVMCGKVNIVPRRARAGGSARVARLRIGCPKCATGYRIAIEAPPGERMALPVVLRVQCSTCHTALVATWPRGAKPPEPEAPPSAGTESLQAAPTSMDEPAGSPRRENPAGPGADEPLPVALLVPSEPLSPSAWAGLGAVGVAALSLAVAVVAGARWPAVVGGLAAALAAAAAMFHALAHLKSVGPPFVGFVAGVFVILSAWLLVPPGAAPAGEGLAWLPYPVPPGATPTRLGEEEWIDAGRNVVQTQQARVRFLRATVRWEKGKGAAKKQAGSLAIEVQVENIGPAHSLRFAGWGLSAEPASWRRPRLVDNERKEYALIQPPDPRDAHAKPPEPSLRPGQSTQEVLVFKPPPLTVKYLRLTLPAEQTGQAGEFRLHILRNLINDRNDD